jgi:16S rRNA (cytosine1402-N4)-methyltransferase
MRAVPYRHRHYRIHPATRTFQAVRIAVNRELETLEKTVHQAVDVLNPLGRICIISFHSLEDRVAKLYFRQARGEGLLDVVTDRPLTPQRAEIIANPSSRSAKLRVAQRR